MKTYKRLVPLLSLITLSAMILLPLFGCGTFEKKLLTHSQNVEAVTNSDNSVSYSTNDVFTVAPKVAETLSTARNISPLVPPPYGTLVDSVLGLVAAGLGLYARTKTKQAKQHQHAATVATSLLNTVIAGVELSGSKEAKRSVESISAATGNGNALDVAVQAVADRIPPKP